AAFALPIQYVTVPEGVDTLITFPELSAFSMLLQPSVLGAALALACIASAESLLCASAVDKLHNGVRTDFDRELLAQGIGNVACGVFGGLPVTGVIVRSTANVEAGSTTRVSSILHGIWLLIMVLALPSILALIPVASLAAVLVYIGWKLVKPDVMRQLWERSHAQFGIYAITVVSIVVTNLLEGLLIGLAVSVLHLVWTSSHLEVNTQTRLTGEIDVTLTGAATFVRLPALAQALEALPAHAEVHIHLETLRYIDHACLELISDWERQRETIGGKLVMEWETMHNRSKIPSGKAA
ncbi:MAG: MFS superfamily sulfate permease-like transporter, partial [Myxococcota bacterium]